MPAKKKKTMDDVSDDDEDWYDPQADIAREANDDEEDASKLPNFESWDEFWSFTTRITSQGTARPSPSRPRQTGPSTGSPAPKDAARSGTQRRSNDTTSRSASRTTKQCGLIITTLIV